MNFLTNGPADAPTTLALAHGAGAPMDTPFMNAICDALATPGWRTVRFEFPYMRKRRDDGRRRGPDPLPTLEASWREVIATLGASNLLIGGKSMGGRIASMVADASGVRGVVCLGYPFHPPGQPAKTRIAHLRQLVTPALIVQGTRDPFGSPEEVESYGLSPAIALAWLEDGDHSFKPRARSGRTLAQNLAAAADAVVGFASRL